MTLAANGYVLTYRYDALGNRSTIDNVDYTFDLAGRPTSGAGGPA